MTVAWASGFHALELSRELASASLSTFSGISASAIFTRYSSTTDASSSPSSCGSSRAGDAGCTRAAASRRPTRRPPGSAGAPASGRGAALELEPRARLVFADVDRLQEPHLLLESEVGRVASTCRRAPGSEIERTKAAMRPSSPRSSRIVSTTARYSRSEPRGSGRRRSRRPAAPRRRRPDAPGNRSRRRPRRRGEGAVQSDRAAPTREPDAVGHLGDGADLAYSSSCLGTSSTRPRRRRRR